MFRKRYQTENSLISIDGVEIKIFRKNVKNLYIRVYPEKGEVRVSGPRHIRQEHIYTFVQSKLSWIKKKLRNRKPVHSHNKKSYTDGEIHKFWGKDVVLKISDTKKPVRIEPGDETLILFAKPGSSSEKRSEILNSLIRKEVKMAVSDIVQKYEPLMGVSVNEVGIKRMKTRWGSCNIKAKRIWLNSELSKKDPVCLEMVVVHEMVHLLERLHSPKFYLYMDTFMPDWKRADQLLKG